MGPEGFTPILVEVRRYAPTIHRRLPAAARCKTGRRANEICKNRLTLECVPSFIMFVRDEQSRQIRLLARG